MRSGGIGVQLVGPASMILNAGENESSRLWVGTSELDFLHKAAAALKSISANTFTTPPDKGGPQQSSEDERSGDGGDEGAEKVQGSGGDSAEPTQGEGETQGPTKLGPDGEHSAPGGARDASAGGAKAKKRAHQKQGAGNRGSVGGDGEKQQDEQQQPKRRKGRLVPGSLLLTSLSASALPNTEKGVFSKQVWTKPLKPNRLQP